MKLRAVWARWWGMRLGRQPGVALRVPPGVAMGPAVETVSDATGRFGYDRTNPVPVRKPWGETRYLEALRCPCGSGFSFERRGSMGPGPDGHVVDLFELSCPACGHRVELYLDMYHAGPSALVPEGLGFGPGPATPVP